MEYKRGNRVEIINYGHPIWQHIPDSDKVEVIDIQPQLVGKKATVSKATESQPGYERYALDIDGVGYVAWFGLKQLKRI